MATESELQIIRKAFSKQIMMLANVQDESVENAFSHVRREAFLGDGPWPIFRGPGNYVTTPDDDPSYLYCNVLVGIDPERGINNGEPVLHATQLAMAAPRSGGHFVHVGAGVGYYSAIMAELAGPQGKVTAIEYDPELASIARHNLNSHPNVELLQGDGALLCPPEADLIYVNAGTTGPADAWLDALTDGGRLILPVTAPLGEGPDSLSGWYGATFVIERRSDEFHVLRNSFIAVIPGEGLRTEPEEKVLTEAFKNGRLNDVTRLVRHEDLLEADCWVKTPKWSLTYH